MIRLNAECLTKGIWKNRIIAQPQEGNQSPSRHPIFPHLRLLLLVDIHRSRSIKTVKIFFLNFGVLVPLLGRCDHGV